VPTAQATPLLQLTGIEKRFGPVQALDAVDLTVNRGEVLALAGDNGAGKSTLVKTIAGVHQPDAGQIVMNGTAVKISSPSDATRIGVATVYQDLALCENLDVVANLFLGRELARTPLTGRLRRLSDAAMELEAERVLRGLAVRIPGLHVPVASLSGGQRQSIAVARAVLWGSELVMLDEPTAALGVAQTRMVLDLIHTLRERGLGVILISHNLVDIFEVSDRIAELRQGRNVATFETSRTQPDEVVSAITGGHVLRRPA
jgi:D-xylose transport system ATP-binding protein